MKETLWQRIEASLDARRSPFNDPALAAELAADPSAESVTRRLLARLDGLREATFAQLDASDTRSPGRRIALLAAAAAIVLALGAWFLIAGGSHAKEAQ